MTPSATTATVTALEAAREFLHQPSCPDTEYRDYSWSVEGLALALDAFAARVVGKGV